MLSPNQVLRQIKSTTLKERQEGLSNLRTLFAREADVDKFNLGGQGKRLDGSQWLVVFQVLFEVVVSEKAIVTKKTTKATGSGAAARKRLSEAASAVRWMTERVVQHLNKKTLTALLNHLLQISVFDTEVFSPVSLDYAKAIRCVLSYTPHLDHLEDDAWQEIVERSFNVILHDSMRKKLGSEDEDLSVADGTDVGDSDLFQGNDEEDEDEQALPSTSISTKNKKRRRREDSEPLGSSASRVTTASRTTRVVSLEQIEYTALLVVLLQSHSTPLLSSPNLASAVLGRLLRFVQMYPVDTSLHQDFLITLSATLSHLALNKRDDITRFARGAWDGLIGMWGTKNKRLKEGLVGIFRILFPYYTARDPRDDASSDFDHTDGIARLWHLLDGEADNRWGLDSLSLDSLRLCLVAVQKEETDGCSDAFVARTFRYGWNFNSGQALAWAILELQANCAEKLFHLSEAISSPPRSIARRKGKKAKLENPISSLLASIQRHGTTTVRAYHLQILLFFIDRHWAILHESLQQDVMAALLQLISIDDAIVQSWVFLCFAAIADRQVTSGAMIPQLAAVPLTWDPIWTHAMRRANVPIVCRAACHAAYILLLHTKHLLTPQRGLQEIEAFAKDLDVQGPPFPYDSVCAFMALCLHVANQDMRLYRMHIEDRMLSWLTEKWGLSEDQTAGHASAAGRSKIAHPYVKDIMALLESICWLSKRSSLVCGMLLPECAIVEHVKEERTTVVIRDFLLDARLPSFRVTDGAHGASSGTALSSMTDTSRAEELVKPGPKERKVSASLLKLLEFRLAASMQTNAEKARHLLDFSVIALSFESILVYNGIHANRRVLQAAGKLMTNVAGLLTNGTWTAQENALVLLGFQPLVDVGWEGDESSFQGLLPPQPETGIRKEVLKALTSTAKYQKNQALRLRRELQRILWQTPEIQDMLTGVMTTLKDLLRSTLSRSVTRERTQGVDVDKDDFAPILTASQPESQGRTNTSASVHTVLTISLQSSSGEPTRDKELTELILNCEEDEFLLACPIYLENVGERTLNISLDTLDRLLEKLGAHLKQYSYSRREKSQLLAVQLLESTIEVWCHPTADCSDVGISIRDMCSWLLPALSRNKIRSWRVRDKLLSFLSRYIAEDQFERVLDAGVMEDDAEPPILPAVLLPTLNADEDIRVRFRAANATATLFTLARYRDADPMALYETVRGHLCRELDLYEHMLTRFLTLGSIMVVSSAVRRGPYWHMLETCFHPAGACYATHIKAVFNGVSERMGLLKAADLFEVYVEQVAYSIWSAGLNFLGFPPSVIGYPTTKASAEAAFRAFAPVNILAPGQDQDAILRGRRMFANHCKAIQLSVEEGYERSFPDVVGYEATFFIDKSPEISATPFPAELDDDLVIKTNCPDIDVPFEERLHRHVDGIAIAILRMLGDQDCSQEGTIVQELRIRRSDHAARVFQALTRYRGFHRAHEANLPSFGTPTVLLALKWLSERATEADSPATTYHVLHQLLADIQRSPLVNEQMRLLTALCLWISSHHRLFREPVLIHTLVNGVSSILAQFDLARTAQSILEWAFSQYTYVADKDSRLADALIRISCTAHDYARSKDRDITELGSEMLLWLEGQVLQMAKSPKIRFQVAKALPAWPREPSTELASVYQDVSAHHLSSILADPRITANKFRVVRRLRDLSLPGTAAEAQFSRTDFWRLKDCIPPAHQLQAEDIDAFANLLLMHHGQIHSFGVDPLSAEVPHPRMVTTLARGAKNRSERLILEHLLNMLDSDVPARVHLAYRVLRTLSSTQMPTFDNGSTEFLTEMEYLRVRPYPSIIRPRPDFTVLVASNVYVEMARNFARWVSIIATLFSDMLAIENPFYAQLAVVFQSDATFAEAVLPILVQLMLRSARLHPTAASGTLPSTLSQYFTSVLASEDSDVSTVRSVVNIILHLRHFQPESSNDRLGYNRWLELDFILLSKSAIRCGAYTTALLFHELAAEYPDSTPSHKDKELILFEIYSHIEEPDSFYGIQTQDLHQFLIKRFHHERQWEKAFRFHGAAMEARSQDSNDADGVMHSLHSFGFDHLALDIQQSNSQANDLGVAGTMTMSYHLGWRTETWDLPEVAGTDNSGATLYRALRAVYRERDQQVIDTAIQTALSEEMSRLRTLGDENLVGIRAVAQNLLCLNEVKSWRKATRSRMPEDFLSQLNFSQIDDDFEFSVLENVMATRISLVRSVRQKQQRQQIGTAMTPHISALMEVEKQCLVRISEAARESHNLQVALNSVVRAQKLDSVTGTTISQEFASVLWDQKEHRIAVQYLKDVLNNHSDDEQSRNSAELSQRALLIARLGTWSSEACLEKPIDIWRGYFHPAAMLLRDVAKAGSAFPSSKQAEVFHQSPDAIRWKLYADRKDKEIKDRESQIQRVTRGSPEHKALLLDQEKSKALLKEDKERYLKHNESLNTFLQQSIEMYSRCLEASDAFDDDGHIRLVSLWFANFEDPQLETTVRTSINRVPSRKFVFLAHQLSARLAKPEGKSLATNQDTLRTLMLRMCSEHPFHSLYQVYCLRPGGESSSETRRQSARHDPSLSQGERVAAANDIFDRLRSGSASNQIICDVERVCNAYLQWAKHPIKPAKKDNRPRKKGPFPIPDSLLIRQLRDIRVPVVTARTPIDHTLKYTSCVWIGRYDVTYEVAGGVNWPKIVYCVGADGVKYKQLFKGEGDDDLRQDAVMEQVFDIVHVVLQRDRETRRRNLSIRRYKTSIDPHPSYRPGDIAPAEFASKMGKMRDDNPKNPALDNNLIALFKELKKRYKPVMRHFFTEKHKTPMSCVATTSIVGHILGLGDRHVSNIIMDNRTGEVVHIDLGIAFEQGKLLHVPERVPFRMTADMVDGMGTAGTQGVFQRCAEETLRVLRDDSEAILTILEVFKYDPLHSWTANESKIKRAQGPHAPEPVKRDASRSVIGLDMSSGAVDEAADRALTAVTRKLDKSLSVEYTVNDLLAEATDPANLALMFHGWGANN
ncbi:hypothetical protein BV25DRAFT_1837166 [Artomyces pyxidatus]|uniref:Uncharacterized protein n=1 Tax=Artomyces pyxidatus TaxID=48021 RepID=A0ACB8T620_9AGAM|nr:hypothetical protein BV25DRAFT_1837166 [Artomyces pyxidatus]